MTDTVIQAPPEIMDFTEPKSPPKPFKIDDDIFYCPSDAPAGIAPLVAKMAKASELDQVGMVMDLLDMLLLRESAERFAARMKNPDNPITDKQIGKLIRWIIQEYGGGRPTTQSSDFAELPVTIGTPSTAGAHPGV